MTPDELWEKYSAPILEFVSKREFLAALAEYGAAVRASVGNGWLPIESAPMISEWKADQPKAIVWSITGGVTMGYAWRWPDGWPCARREGYGDSTITHFMPIPAPPTPAALNKEK